MSSMGAVGLCSICGGVVYAHVGAWYGTVPPAPGKCSRCGAIEASKLPVIEMIPSVNDNDLSKYTVNGNVLNCKAYIPTDNFLVKNADVTDNFLIESNGTTVNTTTVKSDNNLFFCSN